MIKNQCEVCNESDHKYRCPQCRIFYCSLECFKTHKESCQADTEKTDKKPKDVNSSISGPTTLTVPDFVLDDEESEDKVDPDQLQLLGDSKELKDALTNPHLRQIMMSLVHAESPGDLLEEAMHEPIFTEFADKCLSIIDDKDDLS